MKASSDFKYKKKIHADWCDISLNKQILNSASPQPLFLQFLIELLKGLGVKKKTNKEKKKKRNLFSPFVQCYFSRPVVLELGVVGG